VLDAYHVERLSHCPHEQEVLFRPGIKLRIVKVTPGSGYTRWVIEAEEL